MPTRKVSAVPKGQDGVTPYLIVKGADKALAFYKKAFGAKEIYRIGMPDGRVGHAEFRIGKALFMLADEFPEMDGVIGPRSLGGSPVSLHMYVPKVDAAMTKAKAAGAKVLRAAEDQFYGDRGGKLQDPWGHIWWLASRIEALTPAQIRKRAQKLFGGGA